MQEKIKLELIVHHDSDGSFFVEDVELGHFAAGATKLKALQSYFETLGLTVHEHIKVHGQAMFLEKLK